ncbi:hypothetical protein FGG78_11620 [Thioclava sp. BHET1]|nr:hypothetical protein FGG78_11620 [Thioclava sp. BHET1]
MTESEITDALLALVPVYGPWLLGFTTFLSCLAIPVLSLPMMIASGAVVAPGDLSLGSVAGAAALALGWWLWTISHPAAKS